MALDRRGCLLQGCLATAGVMGFGQCPAQAGEAPTPRAAALGSWRNNPLQACRPEDPLLPLWGQAAGTLIIRSSFDDIQSGEVSLI